MKVTLHLEGTRQEVLNQIDEFKTVLGTSLEKQPPAKAAAAAVKTTKPKKEELADDEYTEDEVEADEETEIDDDDAVIEEDEEEEAPRGPTLDAVKNALKKFAARGVEEKKKAMKYLRSYGVAHVDELPKKVYAELIKKLK